MLSVFSSLTRAQPFTSWSDCTTKRQIPQHPGFAWNNFLVVACMGLFVGFVMKTVLITQGCFSCCWADTEHRNRMISRPGNCHSSYELQNHHPRLGAGSGWLPSMNMSTLTAQCPRWKILEIVASFPGANVKIYKVRIWYSVNTKMILHFCHMSQLYRCFSVFA